MRVDDFTTVTAGDLSANVEGPSFSLEHIGMFAVQAVFTGAPVGSFSVQASLDITGAVFAVSAAGSVLFSIADAAYPYGRVHYTFTSGTGAVTAKVYIKGF
jgi:hypothetical protein